MTTPEVLEAAARGQGRRRHPLLHGRRLARGEGRPGVRPGAGDGARRARARHGGLLHAGHAHRGAGAAAGRGRAHRLQPQPRHVAEYYKSIITTRTYDDRLDTLDTRARRPASPSAAAASSAWASRSTIAARCCTTLANLDPQPESVPVNALVAVEGTPLGERRRSIRSSWCG